MSKREKIFTTELQKSFRDGGHFIHKIADMPHFAGSGARFDIKKPFDMFGVMNPPTAHARYGIKSPFGVPFAIEAKAQEHGSFAFSCIRPNQIAGLTNFENAGGEAFIFLNVRERGMNRLYVWRWYEIANQIALGEKSILWSDLEALPHIKAIKIGGDWTWPLDIIVAHMFQ